jgi:CubicO group peptidase (beta-lactamase class C family)
MKIITLLLVILAALYACDNSSEVITVEENTPDYSVSAISLNPDLALTRDYWPTKEWKTKPPQETGMDVKLLDRMMEYVKEDKIDSVVIVKNGYIVLEYYGDHLGKNSLFEIYSCTKSITSTLIGMLVDKGEIASVDRPLSDFFPEIKKMGDPKKAQIQLKHTLTMTMGLKWPHSRYVTGGEVYIADIDQSRDWARFVLEKPVVAPPGTVFNYNSGGSHLLSGIITRITGKSAEAYARENLFDKIGIRQVLWSKDRQGNSTGGWGLSMRPRDMARFGFLFLNNGVWDGEQLVSRAWIGAATADHTGGFGSGGFLMGHYGYQWWIGSAGTQITKFFTAIGAYGQYIFVAPAFDLVAVFTSNMSGEYVLSIPAIYMRNYIIPACQKEQRDKDIIVKKIDPFFYYTVEKNGNKESGSDAFHTLYNEIWEQRLYPEFTPFMYTPMQKREWEVGRPLYKKTPVRAPLTVKKWSYRLHVSKTIAGDSDKEAREDAVAHMRDWIKGHDYVVCGPLMERLYQTPVIEGKFATERIEFLIPVEKVK